MIYNAAVLGFGDNVVDKYNHKKIMYPGGNCVNFAVYAKKFGAVRSAYMGIFGSDMAGELVISSLASEKIETFKCRQVVGENGWSRNTVIDGDRVFMDCNEGGIRGDMRWALDRFDIEYMKGFDLVHSGNYCFTERELPKIKKAGVALSFDFSDDSTDAYYQEIAPYVDYAFFSASDYSEEALKVRLKWVKDLGPSIVCASRGADGCIAYDGEEFYIQKAAPVEKMADTMGAGDSLLTSFLVGFIARTKNGTERREAIRESLQEAAVFASTVCGMDGAWGYGVPYED